jgi:uncharacterized protein YqgC (DUF456 family)
VIYLYASIFAVINLGWLGLTALGLPGNWLMIGSALLFGWLVEGTVFSTTTLVAVVVIALIGELIEFLAGALGSKKAGGSWWGSAAATVGGIGGAIVGTILLAAIAIPPPISTLAGAVAGAFGGAAIMETMRGRKRGEAVKIGTGAAIGHVTGVITKLILGMIIWFTLTVAAFWP